MILKEINKRQLQSKIMFLAISTKYLKSTNSITNQTHPENRRTGEMKHSPTHLMSQHNLDNKKLAWIVQERNL